MNKTKLFITALCCVLLFVSCDKYFGTNQKEISLIDKVKQFTRKGNSAFAKKEYNKAIDNYDNALNRDSTFSAALFNRGNAITMSSDSNFVEAVETYSKFLSRPMGNKKKDSLAYANAHYNRGNALFNIYQLNPEDSNSQKCLKEAANDYRNALILNPSDTNAKYNRKLCLWLMRNNNQQNQQQNQQMLEALKVNEKKTLEKTKKQTEAKKPTNEKDW